MKNTEAINAEERNRGKMREILRNYVMSESLETQTRGFGQDSGIAISATADGDVSLVVEQPWVRLEVKAGDALLASASVHTLDLDLEFEEYELYAPGEEQFELLDGWEGDQLPTLADLDPLFVKTCCLAHTFESFRDVPLNPGDQSWLEYKMRNQWIIDWCFDNLADMELRRQHAYIEAMTLVDAFTRDATFGEMISDLYTIEEKITRRSADCMRSAHEWIEQGLSEDEAEEHASELDQRASTARRRMLLAEAIARTSRHEADALEDAAMDVRAAGRRAERKEARR